MRMHMRRFTRLKRLQQEAGEPRARGGDSLRALQLLSDSPYATRHASNGGWTRRSRVNNGRIDRAAGRSREKSGVINSNS